MALYFKSADLFILRLLRTDYVPSIVPGDMNIKVTSVLTIHKEFSLVGKIT